MKFTGIAAMLAVVTAVTGAAIPNVSSDLANLQKISDNVQNLSKGVDGKNEAQVNKLVSQLQDVQKTLKQLSSGDEKRQLVGLGVGVDANIKRDDAISGLVKDLHVGEILGRGDAISGLAEQITPQVTQVVQGLNVQQVTGLLNILNVNGLLTNVESVLDNLLGGGLLKGLTGGLLGGILKRDDAISGLAGQILPQITKAGILPKDLDVKQLTGLLNILNVNGLLTGVEDLVQGLLGGLPLKGLTGNLL